MSRRLEKKRSAKKPPRDGQSKVSKSGEEAVAKGASLPKSDAVLNCPACMVALCLDCQRFVVCYRHYCFLWLLLSLVLLLFLMSALLVCLFKFLSSLGGGGAVN